MQDRCDWSHEKADTLIPVNYKWKFLKSSAPVSLRVLPEYEPEVIAFLERTNKVLIPLLSLILLFMGIASVVTFMRDSVPATLIQRICLALIGVVYFNMPLSDRRIIHVMGLKNGVILNRMIGLGFALYGIFFFGANR